MQLRMTFVPLLAVFAIAAGAQERPIRRVLLSVDSRNEEWTTTSLTVKPGDLILVRALGLIHVGTFTGSVDASGIKPGNTSPSGSALLEYRIGAGEPKPAGTSALHEAEVAGELKFRVRDTRYDDNAGSFTLDVAIVPEGLLPVPMSPKEMAETTETPLTTMRAYLRTLATAEEAYFSNYAKYGSDLTGLMPKAPAGVSLVSLTVRSDGRAWVAIATHTDLPGQRCAISVGMPNPLDHSADEVVAICR